MTIVAMIIPIAAVELASFAASETAAEISMMRPGHGDRRRRYQDHKRDEK